jgi:hypothetical protein
MSELHRIGRRIAAVVAAGFAGIALANTAGAVDLRDWGRKFPTGERFVVLTQFNNEAVLDKETQLVWQASVSPVTATWSQAYSRCQFSTATGGRRGWRLPTYVELASVAGGLPLGTMPAALGEVPLGRYWSATRHTHIDGLAYSTDVPGANAAYSDNMSVAMLKVWCVRGAVSPGD